MLNVGVYLTNGMATVVEICNALEGVEARAFHNAAALADAVGDLNVAIMQNGSYTPEMVAAIARSPRMQLVQASAAGIDAFRALGVPKNVVLTSAGDVWAASVADHAMALLLGLLRALPTYERLRQYARWDRNYAVQALGGISGRTILVVGLGNIGRAVARRARAFDMRVIAVCRTLPSGADSLPVERIEPVGRLKTALAEADVVVLCVPLTPDTRHLIDTAALAAMKPTAVLVNVSRGEVIDQAALILALTAGKLAGAGLDVTEPEPLPANHPLWGIEQVIMSPHLAAFDDGPAFEKLALLCRENLRRLQAEEPLLNLVHL
ncbi:NAD(P)-dependent oxidoreductase [Paraburkholderia sp. ZP32-5]|uniref:NAD(P)-dependent oxidoreductase n=1 Tax=Paraburkholderia sp. ZP32-5 TaxID=2883245 RepID=UPI001F456821|nr:NAD(P)-dependent oxidoreductase [Paraburkholderia sp. ZP32-5]